MDIVQGCAGTLEVGATVRLLHCMKTPPKECDRLDCLKAVQMLSIQDRQPLSIRIDLLHSYTTSTYILLYTFYGWPGHTASAMLLTSCNFFRMSS